MHLYPTQVMDNQGESEQFLGKGSFGEVWKKFDKQLNNFVAIKKISKLLVNRTGKTDQIKRQLHTLYQLTHENIIKFYGYEETESKYLLKMQYFAGKNLRLFLCNQYEAVKNIFPHSLYFPIKVTLDFLNGIIAMRQKLISNRDIKLENILVLIDEKNCIHTKMIDFGQSNFNLNSLRSQVGTNGYMAPEIYNISGRGYSSDKIDSWSFGRAIFQIFEGLNDSKHFRDPFENECSDFDQYYNISIFNDIIFNKKKTPALFRHLIRNLLQPNPDKRLSFLQLVDYLCKEFDGLKMYFREEQFKKEKQRLLKCQASEKYTQFKKKNIENMIEIVKQSYQVFIDLQNSLPPENLLSKQKFKQILNILVLLESNIFNNLEEIKTIVNVDQEMVFSFFSQSQFTSQNFSALEKSVQVYVKILGQDWKIQYRDPGNQLTSHLLQSFNDQCLQVLNKLMKLLQHKIL